MTTVEMAERKSRLRALGYLFLAALTCAVMVLVQRKPEIDFTQGLWLGLLFGTLAKVALCFTMLGVFVLMFLVG